MNFSLASGSALAELPASVVMSPLVLADRLLTLATDADRAGFTVTADRLIRLANVLWDNGFDAK